MRSIFAINCLLSASFICRLIFIYIGLYIDTLSTDGIQYTDIDYHVFSDGSRELLRSRSPYERSTYRYSPIVAGLLSPNILWTNEFGKIIFALADVGVVYEIYKGNVSQEEKVKLSWAAVWAFNPISIMICTRGSMDSLSNYLLLVLINAAAAGHAALSAFILGVLIHLRLYPVIFIPALAVFLGSRGDAVVSVSLGRSWWVRCLGLNVPSIVAVWSGMRFVCLTCAVFLALTGWCYYVFGNAYLTEALLYHVTRADGRHNFSPYFYGIYLRKSQLAVADTLLSAAPTTLATFPWSRIGSFLPQIALIAVSTARLAASRLHICLLLQTMIFVAFNKVCTAQYFTWYLCLLPVTLPSLCTSKLFTAWASTLLVLWLLSAAVWLAVAYCLEFLGQPVFLMVWLASLAFHVVNVLCIAFLYTCAVSPLASKHLSS